PGDHPDESFSVADANYPSEQEFLYYVPLATQKDKKLILLYNSLLENIKTKNNYYLNLPDNQIPDTTYINLLNNEIWDVYLQIEYNRRQLTEEFRTTPDIGILENGWKEASSSLMSSFKEPSVFVQYDFSPSEWTSNTILVIPGGGLSGLDNSQQFKDNLAQFVSSGGTIVCLSQQHGYEYSSLPGGEQISAYGWLEDQGCFSNAIYIDQWHQILSGQISNMISASVDGYFTGYPDSTTVLLRRTKNNEPAMIMYPYGQGWVIATTMYEDWAYGNGQSSAQGRALIRDIVAWAKKPQALPEAKPGQAINIEVSVRNNSQSNAGQVRFVILDPDRNKINESIQPISLDSGQGTNIVTTYNSQLGDPLGIWLVDYELLDSNGTVLQSQAEGERFAISNPPSGTQPNPDFMVWATSTTEQ
ncbi:MAG: hypothetical protein AB1414_21125, partial [bacterium]